MTLLQGTGPFEPTFLAWALSSIDPFTAFIAADPDIKILIPEGKPIVELLKKIWPAVDASRYLVARRDSR